MSAMSSHVEIDSRSKDSSLSSEETWVEVPAQVRGLLYRPLGNPGVFWPSQAVELLLKKNKNKINYGLISGHGQMDAILAGAQQEGPRYADAFERSIRELLEGTPDETGDPWAPMLATVNCNGLGHAFDQELIQMFAHPALEPFRVKFGIQDAMAMGQTLLLIPIVSVIVQNLMAQEMQGDPLPELRSEAGAIEGEAERAAPAGRARRSAASSATRP